MNITKYYNKFISIQDITSYLNISNKLSIPDEDFKDQELKILEQARKFAIDLLEAYLDCCVCAQKHTRGFFGVKNISVLEIPLRAPFFIRKILNAYYFEDIDKKDPPSIKSKIQYDEVQKNLLKISSIEKDFVVEYEVDMMDKCITLNSLKARAMEHIRVIFEKKQIQDMNVFLLSLYGHHRYLRI